MSQRYEWILAHQNSHRVEKMVSALKVSRSAYFKWRKLEKSQRKLENEVLIQLIYQEWEASRYQYGCPRLTARLRQLGWKVSRKRVARLMREQGICARHKKPWKATTQSKHTLPVAENILGRDFQADKPNQKWVGDITYLWTQEGWLYLAVVMDLHSRKIVGWSMDSMIKTSLVLDALNMALANRKPAKGLLFHSDRGVQYASHAYRKRLKHAKIIQSMSRKGNCWDNAAMESFFGSLKQEGCGILFKSRLEARIHVFDYIESFYNPQRIHSALGYLSPNQFEATPA
jgi:putative transposase